MVRMKKGEPGHKEAVQKWHENMYKKFGGKEGLAKKMQECGKKGGMHGRTGGFHDPELARNAGRKGGLASKSRGVNYNIPPAVLEQIITMYKSGKYSRRDIAKKFGYPLHAIVYRTKYITPDSPKPSYNPTRIEKWHEDMQNKFGQEFLDGQD